MQLQKEVQEQGQKANTNGQKLENVVEGLAIKLGYEVVHYKEWIKNPTLFGENVLIKHFPYVTIYGGDGDMEFYLRSKRLRFEGRIECRFQERSGSVDEKFPYLYQNCISESHPKNTIVIADGDGFRAGAVSWLKRIAYDAPKDRSILVFNLEKFVRWFE